MGRLLDALNAAAPAALGPAERQLLHEVDGDLARGALAPHQAWARLTRELLRPEHAFALHAALYAATYGGAADGADGARGAAPPPLWLPDPALSLSTNAARFMAAFRGDLRWEALRTGDPVRDWPLLQEVSWANPDAFWAAALAALGVRFATPPTRILLDDAASPDAARWLPGARLNIAAAALACPKAPDAAAPAIVWAAEGAPAQVRRVSWSELRQRSLHVAACIAARFEPGTALAVAMPMTVDAVVAYLGVVLAGCVVVSVADSFAAEEVATRLHIADARAIFTQDVVLRGGKALPLYGRMLGARDLPPAIVLRACGEAGRGPLRLRDGDVTWDAFLASASRGGGGRPLPHVVDADAPSNILFSSGTTGEPKAIPWSHTTPLRCAIDAFALQDVRPGDVVCWPTSLGWMMGPWLLYAALLNGGTIALYQGAPGGRDFCEFVAAARVNVLGLVPSIVKAWRASDAPTGLDWSPLRCFSSTGEASSPDDYHWLASRVAGYRPVIEYCGGTEIGGGFLAGCLLQPQAPSTFSTPTLGTRLMLLGDDGQQSPSGPSAQPGIGELALVPPLLGASQRLLNRDHAATYFGGMPHDAATGRPLRRHGDEVARLAGSYYRARGRCDDTMNLGGIKVSSVELERAVARHVPAAAEVAAVGVPSPGGGPEQLVLFVVAADGGGGPDAPAQLRSACQAAVRAHLNPLFKVERLLLVPSLPRTASNKVMRRLLRDQAQAQAAAPARSRL